MSTLSGRFTVGLVGSTVLMAIGAAACGGELEDGASMQPPAYTGVGSQSPTSASPNVGTAGASSRVPEGNGNGVVGVGNPNNSGSTGAAGAGSVLPSGTGGSASTPGAGGAPGSVETGGAGGAPNGEVPAGGAGPVGTGGTGSTPLPPDVPVGGGTVLFSENFESLALGAAAETATWRPNGNNITIDARAGQGTKALRVRPNGGAFSRIELKGFSAPNNSFFGRMRVFGQQFPTAPNFAHFVLVEVTGNGGERVRPIGGQFIQGQGTGSLWGVGSDGGATGDWTDWQPTAPTVDGRWLCMEWQMDAATSGINVWIDGVARPELSVSRADRGNFVFPTFNAMWIGWWVFQGGTTPAQFDIGIDDIVLSTARVGCN
jgi:hypothetical protein